MSKRAQGVMALKQWMLPPLFGYRIVVLQGALIWQSLTSFAGLAASDVDKSWISFSCLANV